MLVSESDEYNSVGGSVDEKGLDLAGLLELEVLAVVEGNALAFSYPVFAVLFLDDQLCLHGSL